MKRFIATALLSVMLALPAQAEKLSLNAISNFLNGLQTAKGAFTQINGDGTISTGTIYIKRPGRVRFEYNPPEASLVMAGGGQVAIFDARSNQPPEQYPLRRTPLSIILQRNVNLAQAKMVTDHGYDGTSTTVTAQDPNNPDYGSIQMVFTGNPIELRQWVITDNAGGQTTVVLGDLQKGVQLPARLFNITQEAESR
ncbi:MAG: outer membrane lipoprotein carrier protein LolA [Pseudomonadota bacterium]